MNRNLYQRVLTGIIGGAAFLAIVFLGGIWFAGLITLLGLIGFAELLRMKGYNFFEIPSLAGFALTATWLVYGMDWLLARPSLLLWIVYGFLIMTVLMKNRYTFRDMSHILVGTVYLGLSLHYVLQLRDLPDGLILFLFVLFSIWATDIGAFFVGRTLKGPKIWPSISPNKTVSGSVGGALAAVLVGILFCWIGGEQHQILQWGILALTVSVAGQIGDFVESGIKRSLDVKDSGAILPGHGGVLDRFDSLLFAAPIAYHLVVWFRF
ncbi:phosphatidate cytidylyltransferase [Effusibacillus lacus]|uniref:Phosphatidate cytidylyltransferase n=1 Tax=Effusibacillus lacus TaxID=1348429 RepID=A0A292YKU2_9BACL|nr:phosphatidate cytidylyltransferase [Effusibacillus lacus]TCS73155.1 phosphatidate cytidylyltransferase [Effusibacillus lacus]GAX90558.1 phosphatidate cytidylyltransferase [Effusibacillus lacus]